MIVAIVSVCCYLSVLSFSMLDYKTQDTTVHILFHVIGFNLLNISGVGPAFRERGFFGRMFYILLFAALQRQKYYFAWKLGIHFHCITNFVRVKFLVKLMLLLFMS